METAADVLIYSNILMIVLNIVSSYISPYISLVLSMIMLLFSCFFSFFLPGDFKNNDIKGSKNQMNKADITKPLLFLSLFIVVITINSGLMYQVFNPAYKHVEWLTNWYWAVPYIVVLIIIRNYPNKINKIYILYIAIAMIGFSFIIFMSFNHSAISYLVVNTLMLGACGIFDLFWWSILGQMLDFNINPAKVFGFGLAANVLGVLLGLFIGSTIITSDMKYIHSTMLALSIVCVTFVVLPPLNKSLSNIIEDNVYLKTTHSKQPPEKEKVEESFTKFENLSDRESQVASLLLQRKTYKMIAEELFISENTVKYYVKNIYSKYNVQSRGELIESILKNDNKDK